jgi:hypothetical protein
MHARVHVCEAHARAHTGKRAGSAGNAATPHLRKATIHAAVASLKRVHRRIPVPHRHERNHTQRHQRMLHMSHRRMQCVDIAFYYTPAFPCDPTPAPPRTTYPSTLETQSHAMAPQVGKQLVKKGTAAACQLLAPLPHPKYFLQPQQRLYNGLRDAGFSNVSALVYFVCKNMRECTLENVCRRREKNFPS